MNTRDCRRHIDWLRSFLFYQNQEQLNVKRIGRAPLYAEQVRVCHGGQTDRRLFRGGRFDGEFDALGGLLLRWKPAQVNVRSSPHHRHYCHYSNAGRGRSSGIHLH